MGVPPGKGFQAGKGFKNCVLGSRNFQPEKHGDHHQGPRSGTIIRTTIRDHHQGPLAGTTIRDRHQAPPSGTTYWKDIPHKKNEPFLSGSRGWR